jgi:hypothetical protein
MTASFAAVLACPRYLRFEARPTARNPPSGFNKVKQCRRTAARYDKL